MACGCFSFTLRRDLRPTSSLTYQYVIEFVVVDSCEVLVTDDNSLHDHVDNVLLLISFFQKVPSHLFRDGLLMMKLLYH